MFARFLPRLPARFRPTRLFPTLSVRARIAALAMIPVVLVVPAFGFWLSRSWVFLPARQAG